MGQDFIDLNNTINTYFAVHPQVIWAFIALAIWSIVWKGLALWKAGRNADKWWFIILLVVNTVGILEILYIYVFGKRKADDVE